MPSNQIPEDVREQMIRVISQAGTLHGTGTTTHMEVSALPEVFADALLDAIAPHIIEWARKDQAEKIVEWIESKNLGGVYPDFQNETEYHEAIRAQFIPETTGGTTDATRPL